jgi:hypothetical protein
VLNITNFSSLSLLQHLVVCVSEWWGGGKGNFGIGHCTSQKWGRTILQTQNRQVTNCFMYFHMQFWIANVQCGLILIAYKGKKKKKKKKCEVALCISTTTWRYIHCLIKHHTIKIYWESEGTAPHILNLGTRWRWVVSFTTWLLQTVLLFILYI